MVSIPIVSSLVGLVESAVNQLVRTTVFLSLLFAVLHRFGIIHRMVHRLVEVELSKLLNGARITLSRIEFDIVTGQFVIYDGIVHSPQRDAWKWDSPLIARLGRVTGKVALMSIIDPLSALFGYSWREIHWVICEDIQVFCEKRRNIFNFHLLDESLDIPDPAPIIAAAASRTSILEGLTEHDEEDHDELALQSVDQSFDNQEGALDDEAEQKANEIVSSMLKTVSQLGKAASSKNGGQEELQKVFKNQRDGIVTKLKEFQETQQPNGQKNVIPSSSSTITNTSPNARKPSSSMAMFAKEGLKVVKSMHRAVERNVSEIQQSLKPPEKKKDFDRKKDDALRIGWLVFRDIRIFTKDVILSSSANNNADAISKWSKPIYLKEVTFDAQELCNPSTVRDENGLPVVGVDPERILDILLRRALSEMAKTNTGRVLNNAMSEVFAWMDSAGNNNGGIGNAPPRP